MFDEHPISDWIAQLHKGEPAVVERLYGVYFEKLMNLARSQMGKLPCRAEDEEDAAQSALKSFFRGAAAGRFNEVQDRYDLWHLLAKITGRKVIARYRRYHAKKRPHPLDEAALKNDGDGSGVFGLENMLGREPSPEAAVEFMDDLRVRLQQLPSDEFRDLALLKLEGFTNAEIAEQMGTYERKIERRLRIIRSIWVKHESTDAEPAT